MRSIFTLLSYRIALFCCLFTGSLSTLNAQTHTPKTVAINAACGGYYEYLPINYNTTSGKYPLLIYISGGNGALGNGTASSMAIILNQGVPRIINQNLMPKTFTVNGETTSYIIISPQFRYKPSPVEVNSFIDYIVNAYSRIDRERICLTGFSIGGDVAWKTPYDLASASRLAAGAIPSNEYAFVVTSTRSSAPNELLSSPTSSLAVIAEFHSSPGARTTSPRCRRAARLAPRASAKTSWPARAIRPP